MSEAESFPTADIGEFYTEYNYRNDFKSGNYDEIKESIRKKGIEDPVKCKPKKEKGREIIDGGMRFKIVKEIIEEEKPKGTEESRQIIDRVSKIPYNTKNATDKECMVIQYDSNDKRKQTNPLEDAHHFSNYINKFNLTVEQAAKDFSKSLNFVNSRLKLLTLPKEIQDALIKKQILLGHALVLANIKDQKEQKESYEEIITEGMSVSEATEYLNSGNEACDLNMALFPTDECQKCNDNRGCQTCLTEEGTELNNQCTNKKCFLKKNREVIKNAEEAIKKQGFSVVTQDEFDNLKSKVKMQQSDLKDKCPECDKFSIKVDKSGNSLVKVGVCTNPKCFRGDDKKEEKTSILGKTEKEETKEESAKSLQEKKRIQYGQLVNRVQSYMKEWYESRNKKKTEINAHAQKALTVYTLFKQKSVPSSLVSEFDPNAKDEFEVTGLLEKCISFDDGKLDQLIRDLSVLTIDKLDLKELEMYSKEIGVDVAKDFTIDKKFLELGIVAQLKDLAAELKNPHFKNGKKEDCIKCFTETGINLNVTPKVVFDAIKN